jgi:integrase
MASTPAAQQLVLFELTPDYWFRLQKTKEKLMKATRATNTVKAYDFAWNVFEQWCRDVGRDALPASQETVSDFSLWCLYERPRRYRLATVEITLNAIVDRHRVADALSPVTKEVWTLIRNAARRDLREKRGGKEAMTPTLLRRMCSALSDGSSIGTRDRAMLLMQFAAGWRCSEVVSVDLADVRFTRKGYIVTLGASKNDQDGREGRVVGIEYGDRELTCPVRALKAWREIRGRWAGPLFCRLDAHGGIVQHGLQGDRINHRVKDTLQEMGVDHRNYGSHSLRSGMITTAIERGASETLIMLRTGQKSIATMQRYVRSRRAFRANPLKGVL